MSDRATGTRAPTIRRHLLLLTFAASSAGLLLANVAVRVQQERALRTEHAADIYAMAALLAEAGGDAIHRGDREAVRRVLRILQPDLHILAASAYDRDGVLLAGYAQPGSEALVPSQAGLPGTHFGDAHQVGVFRMVERDSGPAGAVYVLSSGEEIPAQIHHQLALAVSSFVPALLIAMLVAWRAQRRISQPLRELTTRVLGLQADGSGEATPVPPHRDEVEVLVGAFDEMQSALAQRDEALRRSEQYYRALIDRAQDVTLLLDADLLVRYASPSVRATFGQQPEALVGRDLPSLALEAGADEVRETLVRSRRQPGASFSLELRARGADGQVRVLEGRGANLLADPAVSGIVVNLRDITERHRVAAELERAKVAAEEATRARTRFLANVSHEIRTPMNAVIGMSEVLGHTALGDEQRHYLEVIGSSGRGLLRLIDDLLDASQLEFGQLVLHEQELDVASVVAAALDMVAQAAHAKGLDLAAFVDPRVPAPLRGDAARLRQVLVNLLGNAVDFTPDGSVQVRAVLEGDAPAQTRLYFTVTDTGPGVPEALRAGLFQPFVKGAHAGGRRHGGVGIGLSISRSLVELMGGQMGVEDQPGGGARFWFTVRLGRAPGALPVCERVGLGGLRVLVVDRAGASREALAETLVGFGASVWPAATGPDARKALEEAACGAWRFDAALADMDCALDEGEGKEWLGAARTHAGLAGARLGLLWPVGSAAVQPLPGALQGLPMLPRPLSQARLIAFLTGPNPVTDAAEGPPATPVLGSVAGGPLEASGPGHARVLVAEDNPVNREVLLLLLRQQGWVADSVGNGAEVLEALARSRYDLLLMDCEMPVMDGFEATSLIRRREGAGRRLPIVAVTAHALEAERERCLAVGMDDWIVKPIDGGCLREVLDRWLPATQEGRRAALDPEVWAGLARLEAASEPGTVTRLVDLFLADAAERTARMRRAVASGEGTVLARQAHAFKGGCRQVGALGLEALGARVEEAARAGELTGVGEWLGALELELARLEPVLRAWAERPFRAAGEHAPPGPVRRRNSLQVVREPAGPPAAKPWAARPATGGPDPA